MGKMWCKHTRNPYPTVKREAILTHPTTWREPEDIMLREMSRAQKGKYWMTPLYEVFRLYRLNVWIRPIPTLKPNPQ